MRPSGRTPDQLRDVTIETGISKYAEGHLYRHGRRQGAGLDAEFRQGLDHRGIRHAAARNG